MLGKSNISFIIKRISNLLVAVNEIGAIHGNLRLDNIIVIFDKAKEQIVKIGFTGFEYLTKCEDTMNLAVPDRIDHLPPDVSAQMLKIYKFTNGHGKCSAVGSKQAIKRSIEQMNNIHLL